MNKVIKERCKNEIFLSLSEVELMILLKSFDEIFKRIEEWEFQTLLGITIPEAKNLRDKIAQNE